MYFYSDQHKGNIQRMTFQFRNILTWYKKFSSHYIQPKETLIHIHIHEMYYVHTRSYYVRT